MIDNVIIVDSSGASRSLDAPFAEDGDNYTQHAGMTLSALDSGLEFTIHVHYRETHSFSRRLRATYVLGAKDTGDAAASFTVLPAHISVLDAAEDTPADAPPRRQLPRRTHALRTL